MRWSPMATLTAWVVVVGLGVQAQDHGPAVGSFVLAPARSILGAYRNDSLNSWGGAMLHTPDDPQWPYHM